MNNNDLRSLLSSLAISDIYDVDLYDYMINGVLIANRVPDIKLYSNVNRQIGCNHYTVSCPSDYKFTGTFFIITTNTRHATVNKGSVKLVFHVNSFHNLATNLIYKSSDSYLYSYKAKLNNNEISYWNLGFNVSNSNHEHVLCLVVLHQYEYIPEMSIQIVNAIDNKNFCEDIFPNILDLYSYTHEINGEYDSNSSNFIFYFISEFPNAFLGADALIKINGIDNAVFNIPVGADLCVRYYTKQSVSLREGVSATMYSRVRTGNTFSITSRSALASQSFPYNPYSNYAISENEIHPYLFSYGINSTTYKDIDRPCLFMISNTILNSGRYLLYGIFTTKDEDLYIDKIKFNTLTCSGVANSNINKSNNLQDIASALTQSNEVRFTNVQYPIMQLVLNLAGSQQPIRENLA